MEIDDWPNARLTKRCRKKSDDQMDVLDQLGAVGEDKLSCRVFNRSLFAAGVTIASMPLLPRRVLAAPEAQATYFTWGGFDVPEMFVPYVEKHGDFFDLWQY